MRLLIIKLNKRSSLQLAWLVKESGLFLLQKLKQEE
mgnify:CR=1 FL=1